MSATTVDDPYPDSGVDVAAEVRRVKAALRALAPEVVPERVPGHMLAGLSRDLGCIERQAAGMRLVLAKALADSGAWKAAGARSAEEHAAKQNGTSVGEARADIKASDRLAQLPAARDAAASGDMSVEKTKAVAEGAAADPSAERSLLDRATKGELQDVRDEARRVRQRVDERDGKVARRMHARRGLRAWLETDGEGRGSWNVPPEYQAWFLAALEPYREEAFRIARDSSQHASHEALMADALYLLSRDVLSDLDLPMPPAPAHGPDGPAPATPPAETAASPCHATTDPRPDGGDAAPDIDAQSSFRDDSADRAGSLGAPAGDQEGSAAPPSGDSPVEGGASGEGNTLDFDRAGETTSTDSRPSTVDAPGPATPDPAAPGASLRRRVGPRPPGGGNRRAPAQINVHVDYPALRRGFANDGETCELVGIGPVPVSLVRHMAADAILRVILTGDDVTVIGSQRRYIPAALRRALEARDKECVVPGCHARHHLEIDHIHGFALGGPTSLANTARLCRHHHHLKTHCGWTLTGGPGHWELIPP